MVVALYLDKLSTILDFTRFLDRLTADKWGYVNLYKQRIYNLKKQKIHDIIIFIISIIRKKC